MKEAVPNYYHQFTCIADRCKHSCCIGWEIDIDEKTMARYRAMDSAIGEDIRNHIEGEEPHFILQAGERCPFLQEDGLCRIICECGEDALCDICRLHPRFRHFYSSFTETGLGLCCEEAARIILFAEEPFSVSLPGNVSATESEQLFFNVREKILALLQDRNRSIGERFVALAEGCSCSFDFSLDALCETYLSLERLEESWTKRVEHLYGYAFDGSIFTEEDFSLFFEQLAVYFVFRHLSEAIWDGLYEERIRFALMSCYFIGGLISQIREEKGTIYADDMIDIVRQYSSEIEYSEENVESLLANPF